VDASSEIVVDNRNSGIADLNFLAEGRAWGKKTNADGEPPGRYPLQIAFVMTKDPLAYEITPGALGPNVRWHGGPDAYYDPALPESALRISVQ